MEEEKLFAVGRSEDCVWLKPLEVKDMIDDGYIKEIPESEHKDISFLVENEYISFFTTAIVQSWTELPIMESFRTRVVRARGALTAFGKYKRSQPVWRDMCERFFPQQRHVRPEEMIEHLYELNTKLQEIKLELRRIGINYNQEVRLMNIRAKYPDIANTRQLQQRIDEEDEAVLNSLDKSELNEIMHRFTDAIQEAGEKIGLQ